MQLIAQPRTHRTPLRGRAEAHAAVGSRAALRGALLLLLAALALTAQAQQAGRWIHDELRVDMRSGPTFQNRIIDFLPSGTPVTVLETRDDWIRVRTGDDEGWIQSQYTTDTPIAADRLESAQAELARLRRERDALAEQLTAARQEAAVVGVARTDAAAALEETRSELEDVRRTSAGALETAAALRALRGEAATLRTRLEALETENVVLATDNRIEGLKWGAGAVALGILLSMIVSAFSRRRRQSEWV